MRFATLSTAAVSAAISSTILANPQFPRAAPVDELVGYGAGTTGGGSNSSVTTVTTCSELTTAAQAGGVIKIMGNLKDCNLVSITSHTSLLGVGSDAGIENGGLLIKAVSNVIIRNIKFHNPPTKKDLIDIDNSTMIWIDHCDFSTDGLAVDKDFYDGLLDAKRGSDFLTISWNKFHNHWKASLVGHADSNAAQDVGKLHVTYHHNSWTECNSRLPSIRFGTGHIYSSCYTNNPTSGVNSRMGAQVLVEASSFKNTTLAIVTDLDSEESGFATSKDNFFDEDSNTRVTQGANLTLPYNYTVDAASEVCAILEKSAGVGVLTF